MTRTGSRSCRNKHVTRTRRRNLSNSSPLRPFFSVCSPSVCSPFVFFVFGASSLVCVVRFLCVLHCVHRFLCVLPCVLCVLSFLSELQNAAKPQMQKCGCEVLSDLSLLCFFTFSFAYFCFLMFFLFECFSFCMFFYHTFLRFLLLRFFAFQS